MAAPAIPPIPHLYEVARDALAAFLALAARHPDRTFVVGEDFAGSESKRRVTRSSSDATTHTTVFRGVDNGYRAELVDFADAVRFGVRPYWRSTPGPARAGTPVAGPGCSTGRQDNAIAARRPSPHE